MLCDKCGICCRLFGVLELPEQYRALDDGTGKCRYLAGNLCSIYPDRPPLCNSEWVYEHLYKECCTKNSYEEMCQKICEELKEKYGR